MKRSNFYPNGEFIPYQMPQDYRPSQGRGSCGNCGMFSEEECFAVYSGLRESKILMSATNGDQDILKDNGTNYYE